MKTLGDLGEDPLIETLCAGLSGGENLLVGPGDDCAVIKSGKRLTLLKTDAVVEGIHYLKETSARQVGWKAVARVLSDFAAMGGQPQEILVTLALQKDTPLRWVTGLYSGMKKCLAFHGGIIVGGETTSLPAGAPAVISIAGRGTVSSSQLVTRSGGKPGDALFVTGKLGGSIRGRHLTFTPRIAEADWLTKNFRLRAMMDLSDGLAKDLPRLAKMSGCGFRVMQEALPKNHGCTIAQALSDGEDYELLFSLSAHSAAQLINKWPFDLPLTKVGNLVSEKGDHLEGGWGHFDR